MPQLQRKPDELFEAADVGRVGATAEIRTVDHDHAHTRHLGLLACPTCGGGLQLGQVEVGDTGTALEGALVCDRCSRGYPVVGGRLEPERLYALVTRWVDFMWPVASVIRRLPRGHSVNWRLLVADYSSLGLTGATLKEWAYLDTFDMLAPRFDRPVRAGTFRRWAEAAGLVEIELEYSPYGVVLRARKAE